jgi:uncharacterized protein YuzE
MGAVDIEKISQMVPGFLGIPHKKIWVDYDEDADVIYVTFKKPSHADDSEMIDDMVIRYENDDVVGITFLNASRRRTETK